MRFIIPSILIALISSAQTPQQPGKAPAHEHHAAPAAPKQPGKPAAHQHEPSTLPAAPAGARVRLADLEQLALEKNPALAQAEARVRSAVGRRRQASLYPNPVIGYSSDEVTPGDIIRGGEHGAFIEQRIVTGGKLSLQRQIAEQDQRAADLALEAERTRTRNWIRSLYYQALADQTLIQVRSQLAQLAQRAVTTTAELANVGQADKPDMLAVEIEAQRLELGLVTARNAWERTWRQIGALTGEPDRKPSLVEGNLEQLPAFAFEEALAKVFEQSPDLQASRVGADRSDISVRQARAAVVPDILARAGLHYNRELLELNQRPVGWQGSFEVGVALPLFNRNQGNIAAARAESERARFDVERTRLALRTRLAALYREYSDAKVAADRYRTAMIPRARQSYELYLSNFRQMAAAYPQALIAQRNLFQLQEDYVAALNVAWQRAVEMQGLLLDAAPSGAMDIPTSIPAGH